MEKYLGVKIIKAEPCSQDQYAGAKNKGDLSKQSGGVDKDGYKVVYEDGYISWSPKEVFDKAYRRLDNLTFGLAIEALKLGKMVYCKGWNGIGLFIFKQIPANIGLDIIPNMQSVPESVKETMMSREQHLNYRNQCVIVDSDGNVDNWSPSISDCFAEDWCVIE